MRSRADGTLVVLSSDLLGSHVWMGDPCELNTDGAMMISSRAPSTSESLDMSNESISRDLRWKRNILLDTLVYIVLYGLIHQ